MAKFYKVVTSSLESAWLGDHFRDDGIAKFIVQYKVNEFVKPVVGNLMVFSSLEAAKEWRWGVINTKSFIYECEIKNIVPREKAFFVETGVNNIISKLEAFFQLRQKHKSTKEIVRKKEPPKGTVFCRQVKLTNLVG